LKDKADLLAAEDGGLFPVQPRQLRAADLDASLRGGVQPAQHIQQSGFSAAGGADDGGELPPFDLQIHAVQGADLGVAGAVVLFKANGL
jgi:hypothetical protein